MSAKWAIGMSGRPSKTTTLSRPSEPRSNRWSWPCRSRPMSGVASRLDEDDIPGERLAEQRGGRDRRPHDRVRRADAGLEVSGRAAVAEQLHVGVQVRRDDDPCLHESRLVEVLVDRGRSRSSFTELLAPATKALNDGEKSRLPQLVGGERRCACCRWRSKSTRSTTMAEKVVVLVPHEVGFRMNGLPVPGPIPKRVMSWESMVVGKSVRRVRDVVDDRVEAEVGSQLDAGLRMTGGRMSGIRSQAAGGGGSTDRS